MRYNTQMNDMIIYNKPVGMTPLEVIQKLKSSYSELEDIPITYAGRLDPMAEGLLLLLVGDAVHRKDEFLKLNKTYEATILFGISTDSQDILGIPTFHENSFNISQNFSVESAQQIADNLTGEVTLTLPAFSSPEVNGKPLWHWAKENLLHSIEIPTKTTTIYDFNVATLEEKSWSDIYEYVFLSQAKVSGDFRQTEIANAWASLSSKCEASKNFKLITATINCSSGTYIRSLAQELGKQLGSKAMLLKLKRTKIGDFELPKSLD